MGIVFGSVIISIIVSIVTTKIMATHFCKIMDDHVTSMCDMTKKFVTDILEQCKRKQNYDQEE